MRKLVSSVAGVQRRLTLRCALVDECAERKKAST
jgi:hypothetical protein